MNKAVISGGGTGGHLFPAIAIANELKSRYPEIEILFIGALGKMEMDRVPKAGFKIVGLDIRGFQRKQILANIWLPYRILKSLLTAYRLLKSFQPQIVIGVGGYASGPTLKMAQVLKLPTIVQEQNSFAGKTNLILGKKAKAICVAYDGMDRFFDTTKIINTGNPVRKEISSDLRPQADCKQALGFHPNQPLILVIGGSLGARTINQAIAANTQVMQQENIQVLWQTGNFYYTSLSKDQLEAIPSNIRCQAFIDDMMQAYSAADLIISRAGALSVSELCIIGKPVLLVPSPNVAEDHQTKNALSLVEANAAILIKDGEASEKLIPTALSTLKDRTKCLLLSENILKLGKPNATKQIVDIIVQNSHA